MTWNTPIVTPSGGLFFFSFPLTGVRREAGRAQGTSAVVRIDKPLGGTLNGNLLNLCYFLKIWIFHKEFF
jgi:hypothetical protein